jgi:hypothetical protein
VENNMSKNNRKGPPMQRKSAALKPGTRLVAFSKGEEGGIGKKGRVIIAFSFVLIAAGYFFLKKTDPQGTNIYAGLATVFLLAGYLLIPLALMRDKGKGGL